jgi:hypothetical protein
MMRDLDNEYGSYTRLMMLMMGMQVTTLSFGVFTV